MSNKWSRSHPLQWAGASVLCIACRKPIRNCISNDNTDAGFRNAYDGASDGPITRVVHIDVGNKLAIFKKLRKCFYCSGCWFCCCCERWCDWWWWWWLWYCSCQRLWFLLLFLLYGAGAVPPIETKNHAFSSYLLHQNNHHHHYHHLRQWQAWTQARPDSSSQHSVHMWFV